MTVETANWGPARDPMPDKRIPEECVQPRGKWANKWEFMFSLAGGIIGLGNVLRFPYLCYKNGGAIFFIPCFIALLFCGLPLFFLETALGQYTSKSGATAWKKICPMFQGVGIASQVILTYLNIYYIVLLAWAIFYLYNSFKSLLPWATCDNWWNTALCQVASAPLDQPEPNWSVLDFTTLNLNRTNLDNSEAKEFWTNRVLRMFDDMPVTTIHWDLALCLLLAWVMCYFCIWKGIKCLGKVMYVTVTLPYLLLFIIFIRGVTLPGATEGLRYYLTPDFSRIANLHVWCEAGFHVLYSYAMCQGVLTSLGSYNKYNNNCYRDCLALCFLNGATSIFAGLAVFSVLGFMAHELDLTVHDIAASGPSLAFIIFPKALSMLPGSSFWAVLFFLMILLLGLDTQFVFVESLATSITDLFPRQLKRQRARELLVLVITVVCLLLGLPLVTKGGIVLFQLMDTYGASGITLLIIACCETIVIGWIYGADRFLDNIEDMIGYRPFPVLKYCWLFITPLIYGLMMLYSLSNSYYFMFYGYSPGVWATILGSLLIITPLVCIPVFILVVLYQNVQDMTSPSRDLRQARPHKPILTLCKCIILKAQVQPNRRDNHHEKMMMEEARRV